MITGILAGLCAAFAQSVSYLFTRNFVTRYAGGTVPLLVLSHVIMGGLSLAGLPFLWNSAVPRTSAFIVPMLGAAAFYVAGQAALFLALRSTEASKVAPLLGLKVLVLALITTLAFREPLTALQWTAVASCVGAAFALQRIGTGMAGKAVVWVVAASIGYSLSDIEVKRLVDCFGMLPLGRASALAVSLTYLTCGIVATMVLPLFRFTRRQWKDAAPYSLAWLAGMVFLFACFGAIGVVYGNIVQATRGIMSIMLGFMVARAGLVRLEEPRGRTLLVKRIIAAFLMFISVSLYYAGVNAR